MSGSLTVGLLAHVDAGKTTLSEAMLYQSGTLRRLGRVDHRDAAPVLYTRRRRSAPVIRRT